MANVKNFGLIGVGSDLQFGKAGTRIINNTGTFNFKAANGTSDAAITAAGVTANSGNITATSGNLVLSANSAVLSIGDASISRHATDIVKFDGDAAVMLPAGDGDARPTGAAGLMRYNNTSATAGTLEYYNGTAWTTVATGGTAVTEVSVATANGFAGTSSGGTTPTLTLTTTVEGLLLGDGESVSAATTTGTGDVVLATSPTLVTPVLGAATATTVNGLTINSTTGTLDLDDGSTLATSGSHTLTLTTTANTNVTFPTSGTLLSTANIASNAVTSFSAGTTGLIPSTGTKGDVTLSGTLNVANGGTGATSLTSNGVVYGNGTSAVGVTAAGTQYQVLQAGSDGTPAFGAVNLAQSAAVTGVLGATNGGTGLGSFAEGDVLYASANNTWAAAAPGSTSGVQAWDADLDAVAGLTTTGYAIRTSSNTWTTRSITGTTARIVVSDGDGVASDTNIDLATVTQADSGNFVKITLDSYGRVTGNTAVTTADITALVNDTYVNLDGDTMTGTLTMSNGATVTGLPTPVNASDAANKAYVDNAVAGMTWKAAVNVASTTNVPLTGGATLDIDGDDVQDGYRILLMGQSTATENGIYVASGIGSAYTLARSSDADTYQELIGATVFVMEGTVYGTTGWTQSNHYLTSFAGQTWVQFAGGGAYSGGTGITVSGTTISANIGDGLTTGTGANADKTIVKVADGNAVQLVGTSPNKSVELVLDTGSGLAQSASGLKINAASVTNAMLEHSGFTLNADTGTSSTVLGDTLKIQGDSTQGIDTSVTGQTFTVTAKNASSTQKGVASFGSDFTVTTGAVALTHKSITFAGDGGSSTAIDLGSTLDIKGASGSAITTSGSSGLISIDVATATDTVLGVASFNTSGFVVTAGNVALKGDVVQLVHTGSGDATPTGNAFTIAGDGAISTAGTGSTVTVSVATATDTVLGVASFSSTNFAVSSGAVSIKAGGVDLSTNVVTGTLPVTKGGTGASSIASKQVFFGNASADAFTQSSTLSFDSTAEALTVGSATIAAPTGGDTTITAGGDINLVTGTGGKVVVGPSGAGVIQSQAGTTLTVTGATALTLESADGSTTMKLANNTTDKVTVSGPSAADYATGLAAADLVNKQYVDDAISSGAAAGAVKAFQATVSLNGSTAVTLGTMPAGATVLSVKVLVTSAADAGTLVVGKTGSTSEYMTADENDTVVAGMYMAETYVTESGSATIIATPAGGTQGSAKVIVTYQVAQ